MTVVPENVHSVLDLVDLNARVRPGALAVSMDGARASHAELAAMSCRAAAYLADRGLGPGDRLALFLREASLDYLVFSLGAMRLGAVAVCVSARFKTRELAFVATNSGCKAFVTTSDLMELLSASGVGAEVVRLDVDEVRPSWELAEEPGNTGGAPSASALHRAAPARIIYTSGTTSMPKACLHTHGALVHQAFSVAERLELSPRDRFWTPLPLFHTGGWTPFLASQAGGGSYHHAGRFDATRSLRQIADENCTVLFPGFETIWMQVLEHEDFTADAFPSARIVINVGVPERLALMQRLLPHVPQISNTGSTEVGGFLAIGAATDPLESRQHTAGRVLSGMEARIVDPETGQEVEGDTVGELHVRGPACLQEYYDDPVATRTAIDDEGWFRTGDLVSRTAGEELVFVSRLKDMLKVGGENVAAAEIESHLLTHPAVHLVAVVSAPDSYYGEVPAAFVELRPGARVSEDELRQYCTGAIATFKVPKYVRFVSEWPMSGTKIRKVELRDRLRTELTPA
jgi:fatty-acyl-CoA synthase